MTDTAPPARPASPIRGAIEKCYGSCRQITVPKREHRCSKCGKLFFKGSVEVVEVKCPWCNAFTYFTADAPNPRKEVVFP